jgi:hypothetical protein
MNKLRFLPIALAFFGTLAISAESNPYNGKWYAKFIDPDRSPQYGVLVVKDKGGTWQVYVRNFWESPCERREVSIAVSRATMDELEFGIRNSTLVGCADWHVKTIRVDDQTLEGQIYIEGRPETGQKFVLGRRY